eukprot:scaffold75510_cov51-Cyclotella_meneghiniana.AAC.1
MGTMNDDTLLRLESNWCKHLHQLTIFQVPEEETAVPEEEIAVAVVVFPLFIPKLVSTLSVAAKPLQLQLDHSNDSLW